MLSCGHGKKLGNLIGVFITLIKVVVKLIISSVIFEPPPLIPQTTEQAVILQKPPPRNICNILFILICCDLCPCSLSHHSVRQFVVDFMRTVFGHRKKTRWRCFLFKFYVVACLLFTTLRGCCYDVTLLRLFYGRELRHILVFHILQLFLLLRFTCKMKIKHQKKIPPVEITLYWAFSVLNTVKSPFKMYLAASGLNSTH